MRNPQPSNPKLTANQLMGISHQSNEYQGRSLFPSYHFIYIKWGIRERSPQVVIVVYKITLGQYIHNRLGKLCQYKAKFKPSPFTDDESSQTYLDEPGNNNLTKCCVDGGEHANNPALQYGLYINLKIHDIVTFYLQKIQLLVDGLKMLKKEHFDKFQKETKTIHNTFKIHSTDMIKDTTPKTKESTF